MHMWTWLVLGVQDKNHSWPVGADNEDARRCSGTEKTGGSIGKDKHSAIFVLLMRLSVMFLTAFRRRIAILKATCLDLTLARLFWKYRVLH